VPQTSIIEVYNKGQSARDVRGFVYDMAEVVRLAGSMTLFAYERK
jgi:hypothetical protein